MSRLAINPAALKDARSIGYNHAIIAGGDFHMAGQVAMDADGEIVGEDIATQARKAYDNVETLLSTIDKGLADVLKVTTHIVDPHDHYYDGYKDVYWERFDEPYPCHTVLGTHQLAHEDYLVEIEVAIELTAADVAAIEPDGEEIREVSAGGRRSGAPS